MFENLIKITRPSNVSGLAKENSIILTAFEGNYIRVNSVKSENLLQFLGDLEEFNEKLEKLLIELYKSGEGGKLKSQFDQVLSSLKDKQSRLNYLSSFFKDTKRKIEAAQKKVMECERKLIDDEERKKRIDSNMNKFYKKYSTRPSKFKTGGIKTSRPNSLFTNWSSRKKSNCNEVAVLIVSPTESEGSQDLSKTTNNDEEDDSSDISEY